MTTLTTPSAQWYYMTNEEKIDWLATNIMGWEKRDDSYWHIIGISHKIDSIPCYEGRMFAWDIKRFAVGDYRAYPFSPLTDWNHWRRVEEKMMENKDLAYKYWVQIRGEIFDKGIDPIELIWRTDLPTRCKALFLALL